MHPLSQCIASANLNLNIIRSVWNFLRALKNRDDERFVVMNVCEVEILFKHSLPYNTLKTNTIYTQAHVHRVHIYIHSIQCRIVYVENKTKAHYIHTRRILTVTEVSLKDKPQQRSLKRKHWIIYIISSSSKRKQNINIETKRNKI